MGLGNIVIFLDVDVVVDVAIEIGMGMENINTTQNHDSTKTQCMILFGQVETFNEWIVTTPDTFSIEGAHYNGVLSMVSIEVFTVSGNEFVLHCPTTEVTFLIQLPQTTITTRLRRSGLNSSLNVQFYIFLLKYQFW